MYGAPQYGKAEHVEAMKMYQTMFDNITYEAQNWLPGVNAETGMLDGVLEPMALGKEPTLKVENHLVLLHTTPWILKRAKL